MPTSERPDDEKVPVPAEEFMADGNVFALLGTVRRYLTRDGHRAEVEEVSQRVMAAESYDEAVRIMLEYVWLVDEDEDL